MQANIYVEETNNNIDIQLLEKDTLHLTELENIQSKNQQEQQKKSEEMTTMKEMQSEAIQKLKSKHWKIEKDLQEKIASTKKNLMNVHTNDIIQLKQMHEKKRKEEQILYKKDLNTYMLDQKNVVSMYEKKLITIHQQHQEFLKDQTIENEEKINNLRNELQNEKNRNLTKINCMTEMLKEKEDRCVALRTEADLERQEMTREHSFTIASITTKAIDNLEIHTQEMTSVHSLALKQWQVTVSIYKAKERAVQSRIWKSTVVDIPITPLSFKPVSLFFVTYLLYSKTTRTSLFFNPINIF